MALAAEVEEVKKAVAEKQQEVESIERHKTWNWENMCHVTEERTIINKSTESVFNAIENLDARSCLTKESHIKGVLTCEYLLSNVKCWR